MTLTKADLIEVLHERHDFPKREGIQAVESLFEIIKATLAEGEDILISGFGKFSIRQKLERRGRNPHTGGEILLPSRTVVTFQYSASLRDQLNPAPPEPAPPVKAPAPKTRSTAKTAPAAAAVPQAKAKTRSKNATTPKPR